MLMLCTDYNRHYSIKIDTVWNFEGIFKLCTGCHSYRYHKDCSFKQRMILSRPGSNYIQACPLLYMPIGEGGFPGDYVFERDFDGN